jgi:hypothetical protein
MIHSIITSLMQAKSYSGPNYKLSRRLPFGTISCK